MNTALANNILGCLNLAPEVVADSITGLRKCSEKTWTRSLLWLDNSGLTLYFLQRLEEIRSTEVLPKSILARLRGNQSDNRERAQGMLQEFDRINLAFDRVKLNYAVIKGFSLAPDFCPDIRLRAQSDLDYKLDRHSQAAATKVLEKLGYRLMRSSANEFGFRARGEESSVNASAFAPTTKPMVELRFAIWDQPVTSISFPEPELAPQHSRTSSYLGVTFPVLSLEDSFLLQVIHVFQHMLCCWIRVSWLLELAHFLHRRCSDEAFWRALDHRLSDLPELREFTTIVIELAHQAFGAPVPSLVADWGDSMRPAASIWLEHYAKAWLISDHPVHESSIFPPGKLVLFLHTGFLSPNIRRGVVRERIFPRKVPKAFIDPETRLSLATSTRRRVGFALQRLGFHLGSGLRYMWEIPRWQWLNRHSAPG